MTRARFHLTLPQHLAQEPVIYNLGKRFEVVTNIKRASVEERFAWVILEVDGSDDAVAAAVAWLGEQGVDVDRISGDD
ncbi:MAG: NIL domain-containing protein [Actinomycetota bacterium]|nr:NIL domain-containing protein [Actinomycetota bacterium]